MEVRRTQKEDIEAVMNIYETARTFMLENGNPTQWDNSYPNIDTHENNTPMRNLLIKNGYKYCGKIQLSGGFGERMAFQKSKN